MMILFTHTCVTPWWSCPKLAMTCQISNTLVCYYNCDITVVLPQDDHDLADIYDACVDTKLTNGNLTICTEP